MGEQLVVVSEVLASGLLSRRDLRRRYTKVHRNVHRRKDVELTAITRARAAWLWSGGRAILVGHSAAALLGSKWVPADLPAEVAHTRGGKSNGIVIRQNDFRQDELCVAGGIRCTTAPRTAFDLGRRLTLEEAVIRIDALINATRVSVSAIEAIAARYPGARGIRRLREAIDLVDGGAESPQETRLRLLLVGSGLPRPVTQIPVADARGVVRRRIDMGWPQWLVGVEYDGEQHFTNSVDYANDIVRLEFLAERGWTIVRVSARQLKSERPEIVARTWKSLARAGMPGTASPS
jgi:hypothetical protein